MLDDEPIRRQFRTPRQIAIDRMTSALIVGLILVAVGVVCRLGPAEAMSQIVDAF